MDADVELSVLKLRIDLLERILMRVWVSEIAATDAQSSRATARGMAAERLGEYGAAIGQETPSVRGALTVFSSHVDSLKTMIHSIR